MTLEPGFRLGGFEVLIPLGAGGMGEVYRARDTRLGREVALKVLPESLAADRDRLSRFEQEARAASALNHPNIVTIHEIGRDGETTFIAMELVDGRTLRELSVSGPMPVKKVLNIAAQVAEGLAKAHGAGIVHRDMKPENVMVSKDGFVKILDFGLAKLIETDSGGVSALPTVAQPETRPGTVMGTVGYMSPEQASGEPLDYRSDQFSLGSMVYEMLTGKKPFQRKTAAETMSAIIREEPEPAGKLRPDLPLPVRWVLERCMAKDPEDRYTATRDLSRDLGGLRDHISEASSGGVGVIASPARRRIRPVWIASALLLAVVAGLAGWLLARSSPKAAAAPTFRRLTFRPGNIGNARFAPDGHTILYGARWIGDPPTTQLYRAQLGSPESSPFSFAGDILAISASNELAIWQYASGMTATLARVPMSGGTPRQALEDVRYASADFSPDGRELAVARTVEGETRLEFPIGKVLVAKNADRPRVSPDGGAIAFVEERDGQYAVAAVDRLGQGKKILSGGWNVLEGVPCWARDGREVWFTASHPGEPEALWAVDMAGKVRPVMRVPGDLELDDISRDGRVLVAHHTIVNSTRLASSGNANVRELSWLDKSAVGDLSGDGSSILLTELGEGSGSGSVVYLRSTDGSPAAKLGDGLGMGLSPDGKWVLAYERPHPDRPARLFLLPTGPGQPRTLEGEGFAQVEWGAWLPDGKRVVYSAAKADAVSRLYVQEVPDGKPRSIGPEKARLPTWTAPVSPDGRYVIAFGEGRRHLIPLEGGEARPVPGLEREDRLAGWSGDSRALYVYRQTDRVRIWRTEIETGQRTFLREIPIEESFTVFQARVTPDGNTWLIWGRQVQSALYLVEGLR